MGEWITNYLCSPFNRLVMSFGGPAIIAGYMGFDGPTMVFVGLMGVVGFIFVELRKL